MLKKALTWLLLLCCFILPALAAEKGFGEFAQDQVNLRKSPAGDIIGRKQRGDVLYILGEETHRGDTWYRVSTMSENRKRQTEGWVRQDMVIPPSQLYQNITAISGEKALFMALGREGRPHFGGLLHIAHENPVHWHDVKAIDVGYHTFYALTTDGMILQEGIRGGASNYFQQDFVAIEGFDDSFLVRTAENALLQLNGYHSHFLLPEGSEVRDFAAWTSYYGPGAYVDGQGKVHFFGTTDMVSNEAVVEVSNWSDVMKIELGVEVVNNIITRPLVAALTTDGSVLLLHQDLQSQVTGWKNITKIKISGSFLVGLTTEGKLLCTKPALAAETAGWDNLIDIACGDDYVAALTKDGRVLFAGEAWFGNW